MNERDLIERLVKELELASCAPQYLTPIQRQLFDDCNAYLAQAPKKSKDSVLTEPVAWLSPDGDVSRSLKYFEDVGFSNCVPLYTTPPSVAAEIAFQYKLGHADGYDAGLAKAETMIDELRGALRDARIFVRYVAINSSNNEGIGRAHAALQAIDEVMK